MDLGPLQDGAIEVSADAPAFACWCDDGGSDAMWVRLTGDLDLAGAPKLTALFDAVANWSRLVVVDLRELQFLDCRGLHVIVEAAGRARREGRRLIVIRGAAHVDAVFTITDTAEQVEFFDVPTAVPALDDLARGVAHA